MTSTERLRTLLPTPALPLVFLLVPLVAAVGCGGSQGEAREADDARDESDEDDLSLDEDEPQTAGTEYTASAIETLGISPPDEPWDTMSDDEKEFYMIGRVLPIMHELFARHDPERFAGFGCEHCHGDDMREVRFEMPAGAIYRLPEPGSSGWAAMEATQPEMVHFMREEITPTMGTLLGEDDYSCFHCHTRR